MSTKKIQITTPIVTSVNGQTGDVTFDTAVQSDWQQNDETTKDYVKNRPGGYDIVSDFETLYTGTSSAASSESEGVSVNPIFNPIKVTNGIKTQDIIKLTIDGTARQYTLIAENLDGSEYLTYGTHTFAELSGSEEFPSDFILGALKEVEDTPGYYGGFFYLGANYAEKAITIEHRSVTAIKIPQKYLDIDKEYYIVSLTDLTGKTTYSSNGKARYSGGTLSSNAKDILAAYKQGRVPILLVEFTDLYEDKSLRRFALSCSRVTEVAAHDDISNGINIGFGAIYTDVVNSAYPEFETVYVEIWYDLDGDMQTVETKVTRNNYITYDDIEIPSALSEGQSLICKKGSSGKYKWSRGYPVADWSQNDPKKAGYIANRPGGYISSAGKTFDPTILTLGASEKYINWLFGYGQNFTFIAGDVFKITLGDIDVEYTVYSMVNDSDNAETLYFGTITPEEMQKIRTNVLNPPDDFFYGYLSAEDDSHFLQCYLSKNHAGQTLKVELLDRLAKIPAKYLDITPFDGNYNDLIDKPTKVSDFENDSGYLTEIDIPTSLKNPNALTFTGAATGTYDGSEPVTINIPKVEATAGGKLTFTGGATGEYDGSSDVSVAIPEDRFYILHPGEDVNKNTIFTNDYDEAKAAYESGKIIGAIVDDGSLILMNFPNGFGTDSVVFWYDQGSLKYVYTWHKATNKIDAMVTTEPLYDYNEIRQGSSGAAYWDKDKDEWTIKDISSSNSDIYILNMVEETVDGAKVTKITNDFDEAKAAYDAGKIFGIKDVNNIGDILFYVSDFNDTKALCYAKKGTSIIGFTWAKATGVVTSEEQFEIPLVATTDFTKSGAVYWDKDQKEYILKDVSETSIQSNWNQNDSTANDYIKNRPFYAGTGSNSIIWDGENGNKPFVRMQGTAGYTDYVLISNDVPQKDALIGTKIYINEEVEPFHTITKDDLDTTYLNAIIAYSFIVVVQEDNTEINNYLCEKKGIYLARVVYQDSPDKNFFISKIVATDKIFDKEVVKLDPKYLPAATTTSIGAVKVGNGLSIAEDGTLSVTTATYYSGTSTPANTLGVDGDLYLQTEG